MNNRTILIILSIFSAIAIWMILLMLASFSDSLPTINRILTLMGGTPNGYIHAMMYAAFIFSVFELKNHHQYVRSQYAGFDLKLLPEEDQLVISPDDVAKIKLSAIDFEKRGFNYLVGDFIKKACAQYRNDQSIGDTLQVLEAQVGSHKEEQEGSLELIRYMIGAIASLGFIGTLIGLSGAIGMAHLAKTEDGMPQITGFLNVAFDTTLVALVLGLVLNYSYHRFLETMDTFYSRTKSYIINNLISRIYVIR